MVIAYLMLKQKMNYSEALSHLKARRKRACPNPNFEKQLQYLDEIISRRELEKKLETPKLKSFKETQEICVK